MSNVVQGPVFQLQRYKIVHIIRKLRIILNHHNQRVLVSKVIANSIDKADTEVIWVLWIPLMISMSNHQD